MISGTHLTRGGHVAYILLSGTTLEITSIVTLKSSKPIVLEVFACTAML